MMDKLYHQNFMGLSAPDADNSHLYYPSGQLRMGLFNEFNTQAHEDFPPLYTMREKPFKGLPSAYQIYMLCSTEYEAAQKLFGSWSIWNRYVSNTHFMDGKDNWPGLKAWREEKRTQEEAYAHSMILEAAELGSVPAMKALWDQHNKDTKGRPTKEQVAAAAKSAAADTAKVKSDLKRIRLVTNGKEQRQANSN